MDKLDGGWPSVTFAPDSGDEVRWRHRFRGPEGHRYAIFVTGPSRWTAWRARSPAEFAVLYANQRVDRVGETGRYWYGYNGVLGVFDTYAEARARAKQFVRDTKAHSG